MSVDAPHSPCINICSIGPHGWCSGCYRTLEEIADWIRLDGAARRVVLSACEARRAASQRRQAADRT